MSYSFTYSKLSFYQRAVNELLMFCRNPNYRVTSLRKCNTKRQRLVLGIETSCDDTGAAVVDNDGNVLGDSLNSQLRIHVEYAFFFRGTGGSIQ